MTNLTKSSTELISEIIYCMYRKLAEVIWSSTHLLYIIKEKKIISRYVQKDPSIWWIITKIIYQYEYVFLLSY